MSDLLKSKTHNKAESCLEKNRIFVRTSFFQFLFFEEKTGCFAGTSSFPGVGHVQAKGKRLRALVPTNSPGKSEVAEACNRPRAPA